MSRLEVIELEEGTVTVTQTSPLAFSFVGNLNVPSRAYVEFNRYSTGECHIVVKDDRRKTRCDHRLPWDRRVDDILEAFADGTYAEWAEVLNLPIIPWGKRPPSRFKKKETPAVTAPPEEVVTAPAPAPVYKGRGGFRCERCLQKFPKTKYRDGYCVLCNGIMKGEAEQAEKDALQEMIPIAPKPTTMRWVVVGCVPTQERKARKTLLRVLEENDLKHLVKRVLIPTAKTAVAWEDDIVVRNKKSMNGYLICLISCEGNMPHPLLEKFFETKGYSCQCFGVLPYRPKVTAPPETKAGKPNKKYEDQCEDYLAWRPYFLTNEEITRVLLQSDKKAPAPKLVIAFDEGDACRIEAGKYRNMKGIIKHIADEITVSIKVLGVPTDIKVAPEAIRKIDRRELR